MTMPTVVSLEEARKKRTAAYRERLFAVAGSPAAPLEQTLHQRTGKPCLTEETAEYLRGMFALFSVELDPNHENFDLVANTRFELGCVAIALESRDRFGEATYRRRAVAWSKAYVAYLDALWAADPVVIRAAAKALDIVNGVAEKDESLRFREPYTAGAPRIDSFSRSTAV